MFPLAFLFPYHFSQQIFELKTSKNKSHLQNCSSQEKYPEELSLSLLLIQHNSSKFTILYAGLQFYYVIADPKVDEQRI